MEFGSVRRFSDDSIHMIGNWWIWRDFGVGFGFPGTLFPSGVKLKIVSISITCSVIENDLLISNSFLTLIGLLLLPMTLEKVCVIPVSSVLFSNSCSRFNGGT